MESKRADTRWGIARGSGTMPAAATSCVLLAWTLLQWSTSLQAQVLPLVAEEVEGEIRFWWEDPDQLPYTPFDDLLFERVGSPLLDVRAQCDRLAVSRIYRQADLSDTNARNLGGLYGARLVLVARLVLDQTEPVHGDVFWVTRATLTGRLISVDAEITHFEVARQFVGRGNDRGSAHQSARDEAASYLAQRLCEIGRGPDIGTEPGEVESPTLVLSGVENARLLVAFKGDLRLSREVVADVREAWASEGQIALEVDLVGGQTTEALDGILATLGAATDRDYTLVIEGRSGLVFQLDLDPPPLVGPQEVENTEQLDL